MATGSNVTVQHWFNQGQSSKILLSTNPFVGLSNLKASLSNNILTCSFTRQKLVQNVQNYFDLSKSYYLLMAQGPTNLGIIFLIYLLISGVQRFSIFKYFKELFRIMVQISWQVAR